MARPPLTERAFLQLVRSRLNDCLRTFAPRPVIRATLARVMTDIDLYLNPWSEPGVVPTEPGDYWYHRESLGEPIAMTLDDDQNVHRHHPPAVFPLVWLASNVRYRRRWRPEAPE